MKIIPADGPDGVETTMVKMKGNKNGPVLINVSDFDAETMTPVDDEPKPAPAAVVETQEPVAPPTYIVGKYGQSPKFFVKNIDGSKAAGVEGIDEAGYETEQDAWAAIKAVTQPTG